MSVLTTKLNFTPISKEVNNFKNVSLLDVLAVHSSTKFLTQASKYCYEMRYKNLEFLMDGSRDSHPTYISQKHKDSYVMQTLHSLSGEQDNLCFYCYSPLDLREFLEKNKHQHYTFLPITVHATESANGYRHDMLLIFDNKTMAFYWFDCGNRSDYLYFANGIPKNAIDMLFINMSDRVKLGYTYEPSPSWMIQGLCQHSAFDNELDFIMSTTWCYIMASTLDNYDSPTGLLSILDVLSSEDLFHLLYTSMMNLIGANYHPTVNKNAQINLYEPIKPHALDSIMNVRPSDVNRMVLPGVHVVPDNVKTNWDDSESDSDSEEVSKSSEFMKSVEVAKNISQTPVGPLNPLIQPFIEFADLNKKEEPYNFQRVVSSISEVTSESASENTPLIASPLKSDTGEPLSPLLKREEDEHCNPM